MSTAQSGPERPVDAGEQAHTCSEMDEPNAQSPAESAKPESNQASTEGESRRPAREREAEITDLRDRLLRALAEQENIRRRAEREIDAAHKFAVANLARDLLQTADNLHRAIESIPGDKTQDEAVRPLLIGVVGTERGLLDTLSKHGIRRFVPFNEPFDPNVHEAVFEQTDEKRPPGTVIEVLQPGYFHYDRLLRPATVGVTKAAAAKAGSDTPPDATNASDR